MVPGRRTPVELSSTRIQSLLSSSSSVSSPPSRRRMEEKRDLRAEAAASAMETKGERRLGYAGPLRRRCRHCRLGLCLGLRLSTDRFCHAISTVGSFTPAASNLLLSWRSAASSPPSTALATIAAVVSRGSRREGGGRCAVAAATSAAHACSSGEDCSHAFGLLMPQSGKQPLLSWERRAAARMLSGGRKEATAAAEEGGGGGEGGGGRRRGDDMPSMEASSSPSRSLITLENSVDSD